MITPLVMGAWIFPSPLPVASYVVSIRRRALSVKRGQVPLSDESWDFSYSQGRCRPCRVIIVRYISGDDVEDAADDAAELVPNAVELRFRDLIGI